MRELVFQSVEDEILAAAAAEIKEKMQHLEKMDPTAIYRNVSVLPVLGTVSMLDSYTKSNQVLNENPPMPLGFNLNCSHVHMEKLLFEGA